MSSFLHRFFWKNEKHIEKSNGEIAGELNNLESILLKVFKVIIWETPVFSALSLIFVNIVFWLIIYLDFKFYEYFFTVLLAVSFIQFWVNHVSSFPFRHICNLLPSNIRHKNLNSGITPCCVSKFKRCQTIAQQIFDSIKELRATQPGLFCVLVCFCFLLLSYIGKCLSVITFLYLLLSLAMTVPGMTINFLPTHMFSGLTNFVNFGSKGIIDSTDDEAFLPETSNEELELLRLAAELPCQNNQCDADSYDIFLECLSPCTNDSTDIPLLDNHCDTEGDSMEEDEFSMGLKMANEDYEKFNSNCLDNKLFSLENQFCSKHFKSNKFVNTDIESSSDTDSFEIISEKDM